jgi:hypothetical protein
LTIEIFAPENEGELVQLVLAEIVSRFTAWNDWTFGCYVVTMTTDRTDVAHFALAFGYLMVVPKTLIANLLIEFWIRFLASRCGVKLRCSTLSTSLSFILAVDCFMFSAVT